MFQLVLFPEKRQVQAEAVVLFFCSDSATHSESSVHGFLGGEDPLGTDSSRQAMCVCSCVAGLCPGVMVQSCVCLICVIWRQVWRVAGRESGSPELLESPRTSPGSSPNFPGSFSATSPAVLSLWKLKAIQGFPGSFPDFPGSSPDFPGGFPDFPGSPPLSLGSLTPSLDSQKRRFHRKGAFFSR